MGDQLGSSSPEMEIGAVPMKLLCVVAGLVCIPLLVLWPFLDAGLVSDDIFFADLYRMGSWRETLLGPWPHSMGATEGWRPVVLVSYALNAATSDGHMPHSGSSGLCCASRPWRVTQASQIASAI